MTFKPFGVATKLNKTNLNNANFNYTNSNFNEYACSALPLAELRSEILRVAKEYGIFLRFSVKHLDIDMLISLAKDMALSENWLLKRQGEAKKVMNLYGDNRIIKAGRGQPKKPRIKNSTDVQTGVSQSAVGSTQKPLASTANVQKSDKTTFARMNEEILTNKLKAARIEVEIKEIWKEKALQHKLKTNPSNKDGKVLQSAKADSTNNNGRVLQTPIVKDKKDASNVSASPSVVRKKGRNYTPADEDHYFGLVYIRQCLETKMTRKEANVLLSVIAPSMQFGFGF